MRPTTEEMSGFRSLIYSAWHRPSRVKPLLGPVRAAWLKLIDIDGCEYCHQCGQPVALIETERWTEPRAMPKNAPVTARLASMAGIPAYSVGYVIYAEPAVCASCGKPDERDADIREFHVRQLTPPDQFVGAMNPKVYAYWLLALRRAHSCRKAALWLASGCCPLSSSAARP